MISTSCRKTCSCFHIERGLFSNLTNVTSFPGPFPWPFPQARRKALGTRLKSEFSYRTSYLRKRILRSPLLVRWKPNTGLNYKPFECEIESRTRSKSRALITPVLTTHFVFCTDRSSKLYTPINVKLAGGKGGGA